MSLKRKRWSESGLKQWQWKGVGGNNVTALSKVESPASTWWAGHRPICELTRCLSRKNVTGVRDWDRAHNDVCGHMVETRALSLPLHSPDTTGCRPPSSEGFSDGQMFYSTWSALTITLLALLWEELRLISSGVSLLTSKFTCVYPLCCFSLVY